MRCPSPCQRKHERVHLRERGSAVKQCRPVKRISTGSTYHAHKTERLRSYRAYPLTRYTCFTGRDHRVENRIEVASFKPELPEARRGSQGLGVSGSCGKCGLVWTFLTPPGPVPHSEHCYAELSRSDDRGDVQSLRWLCCVPGGAPTADRGSGRYTLYI
jgi:hypothetical protein